MPKLSPRRRDNPQNGTDVSKSKFKLSSNGFSRKRRTDDDVSKSTNLKWKSNLSPRSKSNSENGFDVSKGKFKRTFNDDSRKRKTFATDGNVSKSTKSEWKSKLSPRNKENPQNGTDFSNSKFKRTLNDVSRQRKAVSAADYTSKFSNSKSGKEFNREAPKGKIQFKRQSSETKNSDELDAKTEKNELRTKKREKKSSNEESSEVTLGDRPKRGRKRITMRLDPYDISNKRMDDSIALNETHEEKKTKSIEDSEKVELSMNAQFRAIKPSPSILTFVEHNLLGRRRSIELQRAGYNIDLSAPLDNIPNSTSSERERLEESIFRNKLDFFAAAKVLSSFPPVDAPEIAFAGRSNVGKSSLLNALTRQWGVVRTSDKPGLTQTINFFNLGPKLNLVDLPGYGFAYAKEEVKDAWEDLVKEYVSTRVGLKRVCLLIDTKWGMKPRDQELINLMERSQTNYQIVLTKTDVVFPIDVARRAMQIEETLKKNKSIVQPVMMVSSKSGAGIRSLRTVLAKLARFVKP